MAELTVFTPTYNRKSLLKRVYESLLRQTDREFIWLIVDDGSDDGTEEAVKSWIREGNLTIRYYYQKNGGKMRAHNRGVKECDTPLFVCLDSDDYFTKNAVNDILETWAKARDVRRCAGIIAHKGSDEEHTLYDARFPDHADTTLKSLYERGFDGETTLVIRTELLKQNLFPEIPGETYVPEDYVYDRIDRRHQYVILPKILTVCELVQSGYSDRVDLLRQENPTGWLLYYGQRAVQTGWSVRKLKYASHYLRFEPLVDRKYRRMQSLPLLLRLAGIPGALILMLKRKL